MKNKIFSLLVFFIFINIFCLVIYSNVKADATNQTGAIATVVLGTSTNQKTYTVNFTTSKNVYIDFNSSTDGNSFVAATRHLSGNNAYGMDSDGGPAYVSTKTTGNSALGSALPTATAATDNLSGATGWSSL